MVAAQARENSLPDVTLVDGNFSIAPLRKNTPESAEAFAEKAYSLIPHVKITELLAEVDQWTNLADRFLHLRTQTPPKHRQALPTAVLADGINLGLTRMAEACRETTWRQLSWAAHWHVREECDAQALACLIDAQHRQPLAAHWGSGTTSSSDAQFFHASGLNLLVSAIILWNTTYLQRAIDHLIKQGHHPVPGDLAHLSPLGWEHINLTGDYNWETSTTLGPDQFRPLRSRAHDFAAAA